MSQSLAQIYLHIVFSTKNRLTLLAGDALRESMHGYLKGVLDNHKCPRLKIGGVADHVRILCRVAPTVCVADLIRELKRESSKWIKDQHRALADFHWQSGYGAFSVSHTHLGILEEYICQSRSASSASALSG